MHKDLRIKHAIESKGLTQAGLARNLGVSKQYVNDIVHWRRAPREICAAITRILGWNPWEEAAPRPTERAS